MAKRSSSWSAYLVCSLFLLLSIAVVYGARLDSLIDLHEFLLRRDQYFAADNVARLAVFLYPDQRLEQSLEWKSKFIQRYHYWQRHREHSDVQMHLD